MKAALLMILLLAVVGGTALLIAFQLMRKR
jgi:hypothetical protein